MVDKSTKVFLETYSDEAAAPTFLTSLARSRSFKSEKVTIDIERDDDDVAIVISDLQDGGHDNVSSLYQNNEYLPPIYKEKAPLTSFGLLERRAGQSPLTDPVYAANLAMDAAKVLGKMDKKIRRAVELQASQVLQGAVVSLTNAAGDVLYTIDYGAKVLNNPDAAIGWASVATADPILDLENLAHQINTAGRGMPNKVILGRVAWQNFVRNEKVQKILDVRRIDQGRVDRPKAVGGAVFMGDIACGPYMLELWTYTGHYKNPVGGASTRYVEDNKCIMLSDNTRLDAVYGALPYVASPDARALQFMPVRRSAAGGDMTWNSWIVPDNSALYVSAGTRPLYIPTAIDTFGSLDTAP